MDLDRLRSRLRHVAWIGGGSGAGKSTIARRLVERHGLQLYSTDDAMTDHWRRTTPAEAPFLAQFAAMDMDERWLNRSPETMLETFHWFRGEAFDLIVDDLLRRPSRPDVVVEGFRLLPRLVSPLLERPARAVWLLPTPSFRRRAFESRGTLWTIASYTTDPPTALRNLLARDALFTDQLRAEATGLGLPVVEVGAAAAESEPTEQDAVERLGRMLGL